MIRATKVIHPVQHCTETVTLTYDDRFRRRMMMMSDQGTEFLLDLAQAEELKHDTGLLLEDGRTISVRAAAEELMRADSADPLHLMRTAWHVGNRHLACEIHADHLVLRWDHVIAEMLEGLCCNVSRMKAPFQPEGGAYGHGRTHSHTHE